MTDTTELDTSLRKLHRSTGAFSMLLTLALGLLLATSVYTNIRVLQITQAQHRDSVALHRAQARLAADEDATKEQTQMARVASCNQYNLQQVAAVAADGAHDTELALLIVPLPRTAAQTAAVDAGLKALAITSVTAHPFRDCSPAGIRAYLNQKGP